MAMSMLYALEHNPSDGSSDYSYVLSIFPLGRGTRPGRSYTYPDNLAEGLIFVDRIGWKAFDEVARYLMMGYRVWNEEGRRLHFAGTSIGYDSLRGQFGYPTKEIVTQDPDQVPDLHTQIEVGDLQDIYQRRDDVNPDEDNPAWGSMPEDVTLVKPQLITEGKNPLRLAQLEWIRSRFENARSCYSPMDPDVRKYGGLKLDKCPLKPYQPDTSSPQVIGPYPRLGIDKECLMIQYPPTYITLELVNPGDSRPSQELCKFCSSQDFKDLFEWGTEDVEIELGTTDELLARSNCSLCRLLGVLCQDGMETLKRNIERPPPGQSRVFLYDFNRPFRATIIRNPVICLSTKPFLVVEQDIERDYFGPIVSMRTVHGSIRGPSSMAIEPHVQFDRLIKLIEFCSDSHGEDCGRKTTGISNRVKPLILFNIKEMRLEEVSGNRPSYITLSYVRGGGATVKTTKENYERFKEAGSLRDAGLPRVMKDAATVALKLGVEYLWIDILCIIQDDVDHKTVEIGHMVDIYANSFLTIVALCSVSCDSPLPGVSERRPQLVECVDGMPITAHLRSLSDTAHGLAYETLGWTFQERLISRKCLYFADRQTFFECGELSTSDHEQIFPEQDRDRWARNRNFNPLKRMTGGQGPDSEMQNRFGLELLDSFCLLMSQYSSRDLTDQSDIENAFSGIQDVISNKLGWDFVLGLPTGVFDWALLWMPRGQIQRRTLTENNDGGIVPPSWSWMGWKGQTSFAMYTYHGKPLLQRLRPMVSDVSIRYADEQLRIRRQPSEIWHPDVNEAIGKEIDSSFEELSLQESVLLTKGPMLLKRLIVEFESDVIPAMEYSSGSQRESQLEGGYHSDDNDGSEYDDYYHKRGDSEDETSRDEIRPRQSADYNFSLQSLEFLNTGEAYGMLRLGLRHGYNYSVLELANSCDPMLLEFVAMSTCDLQATFQGGQHIEEKLFEKKDQVILMLVCWSGDICERVAIACTHVDNWERAESKKRKRIRLA